MPVTKKLTVVLSVLLTGTSAAVFFRKDASPDSSRQEALTETSFHQRVERRVVGDRHSVAPPRTLVPRHEPSWTVPVTAITEPGAAETPSQPVFRSRVNPVGLLLPPVESVPSEPQLADPADHAAIDPGPIAPAAATHTVVDGDNLMRIASRYLGRADRFREIYELNRDILNSPDLLPIGSVLRLPPRDAEAGNHRGRVQADASEPLPRLVPVIPTDAR